MKKELNQYFHFALLIAYHSLRWKSINLVFARLGPSLSHLGHLPPFGNFRRQFPPYEPEKCQKLKKNWGKRSKKSKKNRRFAPLFSSKVSIIWSQLASNSPNFMLFRTLTQLFSSYSCYRTPLLRIFCLLALESRQIMQFLPEKRFFSLFPGPIFKNFLGLRPRPREGATAPCTPILFA